MRVLISWGTDDDDDVGIDADSGGGGRRIRPPSSRRRACRAADLLARDTSYGDLRTPLHKAVAGGMPITVQLLVRALRRSGVLREAMGRTPLESARAYASMPPDEAEMEGAWAWRWDAVAGGAGANWATCVRLLERTAFASYGRLPVIQTQQPTENTRTRCRR